MEYFNIGPYRFMFGPSTIETGNKHVPLKQGFSLWMWNGFYWHVEIPDATDREGATHSMQFALAERRAKLERSAA